MLVESQDRTVARAEILLFAITECRRMRRSQQESKDCIQEPDDLAPGLAVSL